jgi:cell division protein FtsI (penicillin-binding protein 3)
LHLYPQRGDIYDRNKRKLACSLKVNSLYAVPPQFNSSEDTIAKLAGILGLDEAFIRARVNRPKMFVWLKRKITDEQTEKIKSLGIKGLGFIKESKRFYPNENLASHILGIVDIDNRGLEGIELAYDRYLKGEVGWKEIVRDAKGRELASENIRSLPPCNGYDVVLTIDEIIQHITEKALEKSYTKYKAKGAIAIVMDPYDGGILAMANRPTFDPNDFRRSKEDARRNRAVTDCFEPGSSFKIVTASAALNEGVVSFEDVFFCENGAWRIRGHLLHDHKPHGNMTFKQVIEKSSNIGTVKVALLLSEKNFYKYITKFGFGSDTGIDLPGEISGLIRPPSRWSKFSISSIPMGQEIAVTAIQMAGAVSVVANGGTYYSPMIASEVRDAKGEVIESFRPRSLRRVISEETAVKLRKLMQGVVENGTGKRAKAKNYTTAGKTGTAQKVEPSGRYSHSKFFSSFVGFAPVESPRIVVCVFVDEPRPVYYGGTVAAPVFREIVEATLKYLELEENRIVKRSE